LHRGGAAAAARRRLSVTTTLTRASEPIDTTVFASLGPGQLRPGREVDALSGRVPQIVITAREVEQVRAAVTEARSKKLGVIVSGGGTLLHVGNAPRTFDIKLATTALGRIVEQNPEDMTVCCEAGVTLARLQRSLAKLGQRLCIDAAAEEKATIGGIVATNATGGLRYGFGTPRDLVLGMNVIDGCGRTLGAGGRVVKNVAGYDLVRLLTGSWGTLAVVTDVTLRTHPLPAAAATLVFDFASASDLDAARGRVFGANLPLAALDLAVDLSVDPASDAQSSAGGSVPIWSLIARVEGSEEEVAAQGDRLCALCGRDPADALEAWASPAGAEDSAGAAIRIGTEPADLIPALVDILAQVRQGSVRPGAKSKAVSLFVGGHLGNGIARLQLGNAAGGAALLRATEVGGRVRTRVIERVPAGDFSGHDVWGPLPASFALMRELKRRFDPDSVLAPGRFVGGL